MTSSPSTARTCSRRAIVVGLAAVVLASCAASVPQNADQPQLPEASNRIDDPVVASEPARRDFEPQGSTPSAPTATTTTTVAATTPTASVAATTTTTRRVAEPSAVLLAQLNGRDDDYITDMVLDDDGNVLVAGAFEDNLDLDPGPGVAMVTEDDFGSVFLAKFDPSFELIWGRRSEFLTRDIEITNSGDLLINSRGQSALIDTDDGSTLWATGRLFTPYVTAAGSAPEGIVHVGTYKDTEDFDLGPGTFEMTAEGDNDSFVLRLDDDGRFVSAQTFTTSDTVRVRDAAFDAAGDLVIIGSYTDTATFGEGATAQTFSSAGVRDAFIIKLDGAGELIWARRFTGPRNVELNGLILRPSGEIVTMGVFERTVDFDPGPDDFPLTSAGSSDVVIAQLDGDGLLDWAHSFGGPAGETAYSVAIDPGGRLVISGTFFRTVDFDPGPGSTTLTSAGKADQYIVAFDELGDFQFARRFGADLPDVSSHVGLDDAGNLVVGGSFRATVDFDPGAAVRELTALDGDDIFLTKLDTSGDLLTE